LANKAYEKPRVVVAAIELGVFGSYGDGGKFHDPFYLGGRDPNE
jgi:hypothetical protein